ncbi:hypothetical protein ACGFI4_18245 [Micromonospora carbonacea]|uniref:Uncharacterized protein n=1 Tax=Micromonospora carbonacea TaxID=47853 RepID=A0A7H8XHA1_9ACTN|nr:MULTISPECIES: hypothetical protein [Micromonospora]MBB5828665.1 hypothetical protein [Micromonospora carbonacea]MDG4817437.1 hypothetical protein [Micromonospora sp. WMMD956]QLD23759.1 hypothetical protein HXZ27_05650 [Micromonospora carbonacea]
MRHLWSFLAGLVVAPVTWALLALGQDGSTRTITRWVEIGTFNTANLIEPGVYLAVAGVLLGLLGTLRFSPLGPLVAGLLLIAPYVGMFVAPFEVRDRVPEGWKALGDPLPLFLPVQNGTLFLVGALLLMATFSRQRWRRWPRPAVAPAPAQRPEDTGPGTFTLTDWPSGGSAAERDTAPLTLGYPDQPPPEPLPRRTAGESPWSAPPRRAEDTTTELR